MPVWLGMAVSSGNIIRFNSVGVLHYCGASERSDIADL